VKKEFQYILSNSHGGGDIILEILSKYKIPQFIDEKYGKRAPRAEYSYSDIIIGWLLTQCLEGKRIEDLKYKAKLLRKYPKFKKVFSPDTFLYACKELSCENRKLRKDTLVDKENPEADINFHWINSNERLNEAHIDFLIKYGILNTQEEYLLDYDTTTLENYKKESNRWYDGNGVRANCPAVASINNIPIWLVNRNGDTSPDVELTRNIAECISILRKKGIRVKYVRIDNAGYSVEFAEYAQKENLKYVTKPIITRTRKESMYVKDWDRINLDNEIIKVGESYFPLGKTEARVVVGQTLKSDGTPVKEMWGVCTNITNLSAKEIIKLYRQRGSSESVFSLLKEMGWESIPMYLMKYNTVYLYLTALNLVVIRFLKRILNRKIKNVYEVMEFTTFKKNFMFYETFWKGNKLKILLDNGSFVGLSGFI
jgi:hypothetical protein